MFFFSSLINMKETQSALLLYNKDINTGEEYYSNIEANISQNY